MRRYKGLAYLIGLVVAMPWLTYDLAIGKTVRAAGEARKAEKEIAELQGRSVNTPVERGGPNLQNGDIIARMSGGGCTVVKYTPYITESRDGLTVHTAQLVLGGSYKNLVRRVERAEKEAKLVSVEFKNTKEGLRATLILQEITGG
jgi:hypothetical protein